MSYVVRAQLALIAGAVVSLVLLLIGVVSDDTVMHVHLLGIEDQYWALAFVALALGLGGQLVINSRAAFRRERNLVRTAAQLREVSAELDRLARTDALTGIANRRAYFDLLGIEFRRSRRYGRELSVLMLDLDHFKGVNDRWGHPFGDHVLRQTAAVVTANVRESDILGRYGGEEFALALPETGEEAALAVGEKLRAAVEAHEFRTETTPPPGEAAVRLTISIGVASLPIEADQDEVELIGRADQALYEAKRTGRNRVIAYRKPAGLAPPETTEMVDPAAEAISDAS
ncbi:MAG: GGDEF domain-containing protein [Dehalococcoidia bacterium]